MLVVALPVCYMAFFFFHGCFVATIYLYSTGLTLLLVVSLLIEKLFFYFFTCCFEIKFSTLLIQENFDPTK